MEKARKILLLGRKTRKVEMSRGLEPAPSRDTREAVKLKEQVLSLFPSSVFSHVNTVKSRFNEPRISVPHGVKVHFLLGSLNRDFTVRCTSRSFKSRLYCRVTHAHTVDIYPEPHYKVSSAKQAYSKKLLLSA